MAASTPWARPASSTRSTRAPDFSAEASDGRVYTLRNQGILICRDLETGEQLYEQRLPGVTSGFSASPVIADGKLYLSSEDGDVFVVRAGPTFELLATNPMGQPLMATPAISGKLLIVRGERDLFAVGSSGP